MTQTDPRLANADEISLGAETQFRLANQKLREVNAHRTYAWKLYNEAILIRQAIAREQREIDGGITY